MLMIVRFLVDWVSSCYGQYPLFSSVYMQLLSIIDIVFYKKDYGILALYLILDLILIINKEILILAAALFYCRHLLLLPPSPSSFVASATFILLHRCCLQVMQASPPTTASARAVNSKNNSSRTCCCRSLGCRRQQQPHLRLLPPKGAQSASVVLCRYLTHTQSGHDTHFKVSVHHRLEQSLMDSFSSKKLMVNLFNLHFPFAWVAKEDIEDENFSNKHVLVKLSYQQLLNIISDSSCLLWSAPIRNIFMIMKFSFLYQRLKCYYYSLYYGCNFVIF